MEAKDCRNRIIKIGSTVRYIGTRTVGVAAEIQVHQLLTWIKLDSSGLLYRSDYLELVDNLPLKRKLVAKNHNESYKERIFSSRMFNKPAATQISDHTDGPGYGGG
ncbi:MAG: DUF2098 family protein [Methanobacterium sp.]|nr:DUF2098 family protein [Methanobacterium sp.]